MKQLLLVLPFSLFFAGCRSSTTTSDVSSTNSKPIKIALITPNVTNDPLSQHAFEGAAKNGDNIENSQASAAQQASTLRDLATQKPDLLFCASAECGGAVASVATKFPQTKFVVLGGAARGSNIVTLVPRLDEAAYLCGIAAGDVSKTGTIGWIGARLSTKPLARDAFAAGARKSNPKIQVKTVFVDEATNENQARNAANSLMAGGADVLFHNLGDTGAKVLEEVQKARRSGKRVWAFGSGRNQNRLASDVTLGSATVEMNEAFDTIKENVRDGKFKSGAMELKISEETVGVEWNEANRGEISEKTWETIDGAMEGLKKGKLKF